MSHTIVEGFLDYGLKECQRINTDKPEGLSVEIGGKLHARMAVANTLNLGIFGPTENQSNHDFRFSDAPKIIGAGSNDEIKPTCVKPRPHPYQLDLEIERPPLRAAAIWKLVPKNVHMNEKNSCAPAFTQSKCK